MTIKPFFLKTTYILSLLFAFSLCISKAYSYQNNTYFVTAVHDGDTISVLDKNNKLARIRLLFIDAPELDQPYGYNSKKALSDLIFNRIISANCPQIDSYGRQLCEIHLNGININEALLTNGHAWVYRYFSRNLELIRLEDKAKQNRVGLWALQGDQIIPPWIWRKGDH